MKTIQLFCAVDAVYHCNVYLIFQTPRLKIFIFAAIESLSISLLVRNIAYLLQVLFLQLLFTLLPILAPCSNSGILPFNFWYLGSHLV